MLGLCRVCAARRGPDPTHKVFPTLLSPGNTECSSPGPGAASRRAGIFSGRGSLWDPRDSGYTTQGGVEGPGTGNPFAPCPRPTAQPPLLVAVPLSFWGSPGVMSR